MSAGGDPLERVLADLRASRRYGRICEQTARRGAAEQAHPNPLDPTVGEMMQTVIDSGGDILVCPPCAQVRGYEEKDLIEGATLAGSVAMHARIAEGAATLSF